MINTSRETLDLSYSMATGQVSPSADQMSSKIEPARNDGGSSRPGIDDWWRGGGEHLLAGGVEMATGGIFTRV